MRLCGAVEDSVDAVEIAVRSLLVRGRGRGRAVMSDRAGACVRVMRGLWRRPWARPMRAPCHAYDDVRRVARGRRAGDRDRSARAAT